MAHRRGTPSCSNNSTNKSNPPAASNKALEPATHFALIMDNLYTIPAIIALNHRIAHFDVCFLSMTTHPPHTNIVYCCLSAVLLVSHLFSFDISYHARNTYDILAYLPSSESATNLDKLYCLDVLPTDTKYNSNGHVLAEHLPHSRMTPLVQGNTTSIPRNLMLSLTTPNASFNACLSLS